MLTKLGPQKPAVDIIIGQMVYISSKTEKSFHPVLFLKVTDLMISNLNQYHSCAGLDAIFKAEIKHRPWKIGEMAYTRYWGVPI
jgi:hypothetical protein